MPEETRKACEDAAAFYTKEDALKDRKLFVSHLGRLLSMTRDGVVCCELDDQENVIVYYKGGYTRKINVSMDSYAAIIRDVANRFQ